MVLILAQKYNEGGVFNRLVCLTAMAQRELRRTASALEPQKIFS